MSLFDVLGQRKAAEILHESLKHQRVAHAYIFAGPRGVGKVRMAIEFAKALHCESKDDDACNQCSSCTRIEHYNHPDVMWIKPEGNSIKIEQIRQLQKGFHYKALNDYKVLIIENAEVLTRESANSLLKFLEEPGSPMVAVLLAENPHQLLPTIRSRCQVIHFSHLDPYSMIEMLKSEFKEQDILLASHITEDMDGVRDLLISEQFAQMRNLVIQWSEDISLKNYQLLYTINENILKNEYIKEHLPLFIDLLLLWYRDILNVKLNRNEHVIYKESESILRKQALHLTELRIVKMMEDLLKAKNQMAAYANSQLALESLVLSLWEG